MNSRMDSKKRSITIAILLPETVSPDLAAQLPKTEEHVNINIILLAAPHSTISQTVHALLWIPPAAASRLTELIEAHKHELEWVHCLSAGVDSISEVIKTQLRGSAIAVSNGRGAFSSSLAEYAMGAALYFNKQFQRCDKNRQAKVWDKFVMNTMTGKTMGFVGYGHIAKSTQVLAAPFGLRFIALRRHPEKAKEEELGEHHSNDDKPANKRLKVENSASPEVPLATTSHLAATYGQNDRLRFYSQCDFVVCSLPLTADSRGSVDRECFAAMKPTAVFISLGRGAAIDEHALYDALSTQKIAGVRTRLVLLLSRTLTLPSGSGLRYPSGERCPVYVFVLLIHHVWCASACRPRAMSLPWSHCPLIRRYGNATTYY